MRGLIDSQARQRIWLNESRLLEALGGARYSVYYESFRGDVAPRDDGAGTLRNMLQESSRSVAATVHTTRPRTGTRKREKQPGKIKK